MKQPRKFGFTLVELMVVFAIIAILAAILLPALSRANQKAIELEKKKKQQSQAETPIAPRDSFGNVKFDRVTVDGHDYLVFAQGVVHSEACACHKK